MYINISLYTNTQERQFYRIFSNTIYLRLEMFFNEFS